ncbi:MAG: transcription antitermination factor NusB [Sedimentisphaeraceae bacterium JB056]
MSKQVEKTRLFSANLLSGFDPSTENIAEVIGRSNIGNRAAVLDYTSGVLRNRFAIDAILKEIAGVKENRVDKQVMNCLRVAVYEMVYKPQTPLYAVINEAVSPFKNKHKRGFVNAVLRNIQRHIIDRDKHYSLSKSIIPTTKGRGCELKKDVAPDPAYDLAGYLNCMFSFPRWLVKDWIKSYGADEAFNICSASNRVPSIYIRPNSTITTASELCILFESAGVKSTVTDDGLIVIENFGKSENVHSLPGYNEGLFCVQDKTAAKVARFMAPKAGDVVVDLCAAPGTKTTHIAELLMGTGKVIATDINSKRLDLVRENASRLKLENIEIVEYDDIFKYAAGLPRINSVLIDAPCSNTGVLAKRLEARYRVTQQSVSQLADIGLNLLYKCAAELKSCEQIFYSTCSIDERENAQVLHRLLKNLDCFRLKESELTLPSDVSFGLDGGYVSELARLR